MAQDDFATFEEFWPFYVKEHQSQANRVLHFVGTTAAIACVAGGVLTKRRWLLALAPVVGYGASWVGHFCIEKNRPATFQRPVWSLRADLLMWSKMVRFQMGDEVERVLAADARRQREQGQKAPGGASARDGEGAGDAGHGGAAKVGGGRGEAVN